MNRTTEIALDEQVERCRNGNKQAYFEVYRRYAKPMLNSSLRIVNNLADAEDMVQEAFTDAFKDIERFAYKSSFEAWLKRIVINKSITLLRKRKLHFSATDTENLSEQVDDDYDDNIDYDVEKIKAAIRQLPETHRIVFNLFTIDEMPQEEIGTLLGISHNNVRTIYHRAKKKIIETLKEKVYNE